MDGGYWKPSPWRSFRINYCNFIYIYIYKDIFIYFLNGSEETTKYLSLTLPGISPTIKKTFKTLKKIQLQLRPDDSTHTSRSWSSLLRRQLELCSEVQLAILMQRNQTMCFAIKHEKNQEHFCALLMSITEPVASQHLMLSRSVGVFLQM